MHVQLPIHPVFGPAIGLRRNGAPIWPVRGASQEGDPPAADPTATNSAVVMDNAPASSSDEALGEGGKKALDAERATNRELTKERNALAAQVKAFEDAQKTESQKTADRIADLEKDAAKAIRYEAAEKSGLPLSLASRLSGSTLDELIADAEELKQLVGSAAPAAPAAPSTPKPDPRQGGGQADAGGSLAAGKALYASRKPAHK
ncbi:hypothetical protein [Micromonospora sp. NPDC048169]|uniref:hypothetical protein n=1 Tax=Micromonospora sp. NPDC048169 TaxID=3154711 RepID=UPI0033C6721F